MTDTPVCHYCREPFTWRRKGAIYCSPACRRAIGLLRRTLTATLIAEVDRRREGYAGWLIQECAESAREEGKAKVRRRS